MYSLSEILQELSSLIKARFCGDCDGKLAFTKRIRKDNYSTIWSSLHFRLCIGFTEDWGGGGGGGKVG